MAKPLVGQITTSGSRQQITAVAQDVTAFTVRAPLSNTTQVEIGDSTLTLGSGFILDPGDSITYERTNQVGNAQYQLKLSDFYAVGAGGKVTWFASP